MNKTKTSILIESMLKEYGEIIEEDFFNVAGNSKAELGNLNEKSPYSPEEIVKRARSRIGSYVYNVLKYNSEHFVMEVKYNEANSKQAKKWLKKLGDPWTN
ncbi:uncharacterized protein LOC131953593 [Physella acuta]|uniref:uncharacterized protein LOC131953593 n=1 Tax=Physella acuta TaxID=109671 RepID=UPI0027DE0FAC|nr:uncharacterized protein LOC131953593 [Physella acuta]XP_059172815.1 uncharacterized protein LOC131953593 [Physella acuta]XP_059172816.1 uncharacterized protein LOC131953593 [Physella acuta]XP_059172817.1 uncharacterized protein LOC131953593 [Physella acuta]